MGKTTNKEDNLRNKVTNVKKFEIVKVDQKQYWKTGNKYNNSRMK